MNEYEDEWLRIGSGLRAYQPEGQPETDYAGFRAMQEADRQRPRRRLLAWLGFGILLLMASSITLVLSGPEPATKLYISDSDTAALSGVNPISIDLSFPIAESTPPSLSATPTKQATLPKPERSFSPVVRDRFSAQQVQLPKSSGVPPSSSEPLLSGNFFAEAGGFAVSAKLGASRNEMVLSRLDWPRVKLPTTDTVSVSLETGGLLPLSDEPFAAKNKRPYFSFNGGLSTHWRGNSFLEDADQGVYVSIGIRQQLGRFTLDGRFGYRGHNMNLKVLEGTEKPWSHYEEKSNLFNDQGEEVEYTYVGIVDGYKGLEFSLLVSYQLNNRFSMQAGGRYSLPSLSFRRTVHSSHDGDVTGEPNPYHFFTTQTPLVKYYDYGALAGGQYRINKFLSLEAMLHLGMVDLIEDEGERMSRFNHSSSVSIGLSYRLQ